MKIITATVLSLSLGVSSALAGQTPLAPGKPAGVNKAQFNDVNTVMIIGGIGLAAAGIAIAASAGNASGPTTSTSSSTSTTTTSTSTTS